MERAVANRYVAALADVVTQPGSELSPEDALQQLEEFGELLAGTAELAAVLRAPSIRPRDKRDLIAEIGSRLGFARPIVNFLSVVADHRRIGHYALIADRFRAWLDGYRNRVAVQVRSAGPLAADQKFELERRFRELTGKDIRATYAQDGSLLGGGTVQVGSILYDGSLRAALGTLGARLAAAER